MKKKTHFTYLPTQKPRTAAAMRKFLANHDRYSTMNSWNRATSYAVNIKISHLRLTTEEANACYDLLSCQDCAEYSGFNDRLRDFDREHDYEWQIGINGRSGGYAVLYRGGRKPSGYKSYCPSCGQKCYEAVADRGNRCGRCGANSRVNFSTPHMSVEVYPGKGVDDSDGDVENMDPCEVRDRFELVWAFDVAVEQAVADFVTAALNSTVEEREIPRGVETVNVAIPKKRKSTRGK